MLRLVLSLLATFGMYVLCLNLNWTDLLGTTLVCLTMGGFLMNELRIILREIRKTNNK
jgi:hypothetical protein